jgi:hypothetical protein
MQQALFDEFGRRIPFPGMRVYNQVSRRHYLLNQPEIDYDGICGRTREHLQLGRLSFPTQGFKDTCESILEELSVLGAVANITKGVRVPFLCPRIFSDTSLGRELRWYVEKAGDSFKERFPDYAFYDLAASQGKPEDDMGFAKGSRYELFEEARQEGPVAGWYFPSCLSEYDLASMRAQMASLPERFVLSGGVEAAAAIIGSPDLLFNRAAYPPHLCLAALLEPDDAFFYSFEAYGLNLVFNRRNNALTPSATQVSEQFAGGLTVFAPFG